MPPLRRDLGPTEVEEEVLVPGPAARLHGATVEAASVARQTLRSGKNSQFCLILMIYLRVPLSATIPSGMSPPILLHLIILPKLPRPPASHSTCRSFVSASHSLITCCVDQMRITSIRLPTLYPCALGLIEISGFLGFTVTPVKQLVSQS